MKTDGRVKQTPKSASFSKSLSDSYRKRRVQVAGVPSSRAARLRTSWFVIGTTFGMLLSSAGHWASDFSLDSFEAASLPEIPSLTLAFPGGEDDDADTAAAEGLDEKEAAPAVMAKPAPPPIQWPRELSITVSSGDRLIDILTKHGVDHAAAFEIVRQMRKSFDPRRLRTGHELELVLEKDSSRSEDIASKLKKLTIHVSNIETVAVTAAGANKWYAEKIKKPVLAETRHGGAKIKSSFYLTAQQQGIPDKAIVELIRAYSYDVDFQRDIKVGDALEVMYESMVTEDGEFVSTGDVLYAELKTRGRSFKIYHFTNSAGISSYYNDKGENVRKALLRTPVDGARISSGFGMRRHPILGYSKMHRGVDFAAPRGTPIYAAGDGVVEFAGPYSSYGNYVRIRHNGTYKTAYAHASRIASGIRNGSKVRQGQVVAYVGTTGRSTGPHLHYEILRGSTQVNPAGVKFAGGDKLVGRELAKFQETKRGYETKLATLKATPTKLASAQ